MNYQSKEIQIVEPPIALQVSKHFACAFLLVEFPIFHDSINTKRWITYTEIKSILG